MFAKIALLLPPNVIRFVGRLQFTLPVLGPLIGKFGRGVLATRGIIKHGAGAGLHFDATGGYPGYLMGTTEPIEQALLVTHLRPGGVFYDVGANIGFFTTIAARLVGPGGRVYAFEPLAISAKSIRTNAAANGFAHVEIIEAAVSDGPGMVSFSLGEHSAVHRIADGGISTSVPAVSIDSFLAATAARPPDLVLMDVEGEEIKVLAGMLETIRRHRPAIMCEVHWLNDEFIAFCARELAPLGYQATTYTGEPLPTTPQRFHALLTAPRA